MNYIDLFSGIGGFALGAWMAGMKFEKHYFSEIDPFCVELYKKRFPEAIALGDIKNHGEWKIESGQYIITGGFPCQDISVAGRGKGIGGARSGLWHEMLGVITQIRPRFAIVENVAALSFRGLDVVCGGLAQIGYDAEWSDIRASDALAPHRRERIWIVAYPNGKTQSGCTVHAGKGSGELVPNANGYEQRRECFTGREKKKRITSIGYGEEMANAECRAIELYRGTGTIFESENGNGQTRKIDKGGDPVGDFGEAGSCGTDGESIGTETNEIVANAEKHSFRAGLCADKQETIRKRRFSDGGCSISDAEGNGREKTILWEPGAYGIGGADKISDTDGAGCAQQRRPVANETQCNSVECGCEEFCNTECGRCGRIPRRRAGAQFEDGYAQLSERYGKYWAVEPNVGRLAYGVSRRVDRLRGLGNSIVPQIAAHLFTLIQNNLGGNDGKSEN